MSRPRRRRRVRGRPNRNIFKPKGVPLSSLKEINLGSDELEALRLKHLENLNQEEAAKKMGVSRSTFARILKQAHKKVTEFLVEERSMSIEDSEYIQYKKNQKNRR